MRAIHAHEIQHEPLPQAISARWVLELFELPALFLGLVALWAIFLGAVPWWLFAGAGFYGTLSAMALGYQVWHTRKALVRNFFERF